MTAPVPSESVRVGYYKIICIKSRLSRNTIHMLLKTLARPARPRASRYGVQKHSARPLYFEGRAPGRTRTYGPRLRRQVQQGVET